MNKNIKNYRAVKAAIKQWERGEIKHAKASAADPAREAFGPAECAESIKYTHERAAELLELLEAANKAPRLEEVQITINWKSSKYGYQAMADGIVDWGTGSVFSAGGYTTGWGYCKESTAAGDMLACLDKKSDSSYVKGLKATARAVLARLLVENYHGLKSYFPFGRRSEPVLSFGCLCGCGMGCLTAALNPTCGNIKGYTVKYRAEHWYIIKRGRYSASK